MDRRQFSRGILMAGIGAEASLAQAGSQSSGQKKSLKQRFHENDQIDIFRVPSVATPEHVQKAIRENKPDLIYVDSHHEPYCDMHFKQQCQAAEELGVGVQLRIPSLGHRHLIGRFCDMGALAIKVPSVETPEEVQESLDSFYFRPKGNRSWGNCGFNNKLVYASGLTQSELKFEDKRVYTDWWNENAIIGFKIESIHAVLNVKQLALPGVDYFDFGGSDLGIDLAIRGHSTLKTLDDCKAYVRREIEGLPIKFF